MTPATSDLKVPGKESRPRPQYFLVRPTGQIVPLVAADELPLEVNLVGLVRSLEVEETVGMLNLGLVKSNGALYQQIDPKPAKVEGPTQVDADKTKEKPNTAQQPLTPPTTPIGPKDPLQNRIGGSNTTVASPSMAPNVHEPMTQEICKHWCAHGVCRWGSRCHYQHTMPLTKAGLREAGLSDWPNWYRTLNPWYFDGQAAFVTPSIRRRRPARNEHGNGACLCHPVAGRIGRRQAIVNAVDVPEELRVRDGRITGLSALMSDEGRLEGLGVDALKRLAAKIREKELAEEKNREAVERLAAKIREKELAEEKNREAVERESKRSAETWEDDGSENGNTDKVPEQPLRIVEKAVKGDAKLVDV